MFLERRGQVFWRTLEIIAERAGRLAITEGHGRDVVGVVGVKERSIPPVRLGFVRGAPDEPIQVDKGTSNEHCRGQRRADQERTGLEMVRRWGPLHGNVARDDTAQP